MTGRRRIAGTLAVLALVTTAGASVGDHDVVKDALESLGLVSSSTSANLNPADSSQTQSNRVSSTTTPAGRASNSVHGSRSSGAEVEEW